MILINTSILDIVLDFIWKKFLDFLLLDMLGMFFRVDMDSSVHIDNKKKYILILGKSLIQGLDGTTLAAEKMFSHNFTEHNKKFCLRLYYNGANSYLFVNGTEIIKFKAKVFVIVATPLCLGKLSKYLSVENTGFYGDVYEFNDGYDAIVVNDIIDIHKDLIKKHNIK